MWRDEPIAAESIDYRGLLGHPPTAESKITRRHRHELHRLFAS